MSFCCASWLAISSFYATPLRFVAYYERFEIGVGVRGQGGNYPLTPNP
jgi:hypothetical protein